MFNYSYGNGGSVVDDPNLLSVVGQPINSNHPFFPDGEFVFPSSSNDYLMQRSGSTHSFVSHAGITDHSVPVNPFYYSSPPVSARRVYSTGDLQVSAEKCTTQEGIDAAVTAGWPVGRYTAEERKERIDRYRSKRNLRNFNKKITYACRKTLADSRPRVRGRFARNGEAENEEPPDESSETSFECYSSYSTCDNGKSRNSSRNSLANGEEGGWWKQMQGVLTPTDEEEEEDIWASLDTVFSVNHLLS